MGFRRAKDELLMMMLAGQYDFLPELQVHFPHQGVGYVRQAVWRFENLVIEIEYLEVL